MTPCDTENVLTVESVCSRATECNIHEIANTSMRYDTVD